MILTSPGWCSRRTSCEDAHHPEFFDLQWWSLGSQFLPILLLWKDPELVLVEEEHMYRQYQQKSNTSAQLAGGIEGVEMIKKLICLLWGHRTVVRAYTGEKISSSNGVCESDTLLYIWKRMDFCLRCGKSVKHEGE